jgi:hypothetical protein
MNWHAETNFAVTIAGGSIGGLCAGVALRGIGVGIARPRCGACSVVGRLLFDNNPLRGEELRKLSDVRCNPQSLFSRKQVGG